MLLGTVLQILALLGGAGGILVGLSILTEIVREYRFGYRRSESRSVVGIRLSTEMSTVVVWGMGIGGIVTVFGLNSYTWSYFLKLITLALGGTIFLYSLMLSNKLQKKHSFTKLKFILVFAALVEGIFLILGLTESFSDNVIIGALYILGSIEIAILEVPVSWCFWKKDWELMILGESHHIKNHFVYWYGLLVEFLLLLLSGSIATVFVINHFFDIQHPLQLWTMFTLGVLGSYTLLVSAYYYVFLLGPISEHGHKVLLCHRDKQQWRGWLMDEDKKFYYIATSQEKARQMGCNVRQNDPRVIIISIPKEEVTKIAFIHQNE